MMKLTRRKITNYYEDISMPTNSSPIPYGNYILRGTTTDGTTVVDLTTDGGAPTVENTVTLADNSQMHITYSIQGRASDGAAAVNTGQYFIRRLANAASTEGIPSGFIVSEPLDFGTTTAVADVAIDTTLGGLRVFVIGEAALTMEWVAEIHTVNLFG